MHEAILGLEELIDALSGADQRALEHHLIRLMQHIIKRRYLRQHTLLRPTKLVSMEGT